jgi:hypothetical protein
MMVRVSIFLLFLGTFDARIFAQVLTTIQNQQDQSLRQLLNEKTIAGRQHLFVGSMASMWFDVTYYHLDLDIVTYT